MNELTGQTILVTGAKGGLGSFVTEAFLGAGATVVGVSRSIQPADFSHPEFYAMPAELSSTSYIPRPPRRRRLRAQNFLTSRISSCRSSSVRP